MSKGLLLLFIFLSVVSCDKEDEYLYTDLTPRKEENNLTRKIIIGETVIDILFVIDNSGSMSSIQNNIIKNAAIFMENFLSQSNLDWRIGIVSTDKDDKPYLGFSPTFSRGVANPVKVFQDAVRKLGTWGDASEYVFYNAYRFMTDLEYAHFFRENAHLAVIMVTDEEEQSEKKFGAQYEVYNFFNTLTNFKDGRVLRFYGAFNFADIQGCSYGNSYYAGSPFETIINESEGRYISACSKDFGKDLASIGEDIVSIGSSQRFALEGRPKIGTIKVTYVDKLLPEGKKEDGGVWYYDKYFNSVNFYDNKWIIKGHEEDPVHIKFDIDDGWER